MNCPYCETPLAPGSAVCPACGAKLAQPAERAEPAPPSQAAPAPPPQNRFCANCGRELRAGTLFCVGCGMPVGGQQQPRQNTAVPYPPQQSQTPAAPTTPYARGQAPNAPYPPQYAPQQRQASPYAQPYRPQPYPQAQPRRKRKPAVPIIAAILVIAILFTGLVTPGFFLKEKRAEALINRVEVHLPNPTGPEAAVRLAGELAVQYYIEAQLYLETLSGYEEDDVDADAFTALATNTLKAFENAELMCDCVTDAVDL